MKNVLPLCLVAVTTAVAQTQFSIAPMSTFGNSGWLPPMGTNGSTYTYLATTGNERSIAYGNGHLYLSSGTATAPAIRILNPLTGADLGFLDVTGIAGGARVLVNLGVGADGAIYGANLSTALNTETGAYKVYRWANESAAPVVVYSGAPLAGARLGDSMDVTGGGSATRIVAGFGSSPNVAGNNGYVIIDPSASTSQTVSFTGTPPNAGDFRLGLGFAADAGTVIGDQGGGVSDTRLTIHAAGAGTLTASLTLSAAGERQMDYAIINGVSYLATIETGGAATASTVRIYDMINPASPLFLGSAKTATSANANANGTGGIAWGAVTDNGDGTATAQLFAMNSNNGIEAFLVVVPEPSVATLALLGIGVWAIRRKQQS